MTSLPEHSALDRQRALWCGVEWEKSNYGRLMATERSRQIHSDRAMAYIGLLHGITMGVMERARGDESCPEGAKRRVQDFIAARWQ